MCLTASLKVKREFIQKRYAEPIAAELNKLEAEKTYK
jgi:hypothetical protein